MVNGVEIATATIGKECATTGVGPGLHRSARASPG